MDGVRWATLSGGFQELPVISIGNTLQIKYEFLQHTFLLGMRSAGHWMLCQMFKVLQ